MTEETTTKTDDEDMPVIVASEGARNHEITPYMTYDAKQKRCRYFVQTNQNSGPDYEVTQGEYRDILATIALDLRHEVLSLLDNRRTAG